MGRLICVPGGDACLYHRFAHLVEGEDQVFLTNVYGYTVNPTKACFESWLSLLDNFSFDKRTPYFNLLVPTAETTCYKFLLDKLMRSGEVRVLPYGSVMPPPPLVFHEGVGVEPAHWCCRGTLDCLPSCPCQTSA